MAKEHAQLVLMYTGRVCVLLNTICTEFGALSIGLININLRQGVNTNAS